MTDHGIQGESLAGKDEVQVKVKHWEAEVRNLILRWVPDSSRTGLAAGQCWEELPESTAQISKATFYNCEGEGVTVWKRQWWTRKMLRPYPALKFAGDGK